MDEEIEFHIAERVDQLTRLGWTRDAARDEARRRFGSFDETMAELHNAARKREERLGMLETLREVGQDLRYGTRLLRRYPGFALTAIITLAVGIGAASAMFAVVQHSLLAPLAFAHPDRLVFMGEEYRANQPMLVSYPNFDDWRARAHSFDAMEALTFADGAPVLGADEPVIARVQNVSRGFFQMLGVQPIVGRWIAPSENRPGADATIVVGEAFWRQHLGATTDLSRVKLTLWGRPRTIVGVMPSTFRILGSADIWFPLEIDPVRIRGAGNYWVIGRLRPGVTLAAARREMNGIAAELKRTYGDASISAAVVTVPLIDRVVANTRRPLLILLGAAVFVLVVTCVNVAMMLMARGTARLREAAVRVAFGAARWRLIRQAVVETTILVAAGSVGGVLIAWGGVVAMRTWGVGLVPRLNELRLDARVIAFAVLVAALVAIGFSIIPALASRRATHGALGAAAMRASRPSHAWSVLLAIQAAAAVTLIVNARLVMRTVENILDTPAGFDARDVTVTTVPLATNAYSSDTARAVVGDRIVRELAAALPGSDVALGSALPTDQGGGNSPLLLPPITNPNSQKEWAAISRMRFVSPGFFHTIRMTLHRGRVFNEGDRDGSPDVAIVNQSLADKLWPGQNPIGRRVRPLADRRGALFTVVGVVNDARDWRIPAGQQLEMYVPFAQRPPGFVYAVVRSTAPEAVVAATTRRVVRGIDANLPLRSTTLASNIDETMADRRFLRGMLVSFAVIVLMLTVVGTTGAVSYAVMLRTREIGIRLAIGATPSGIWLSVERGILAVLGLGAGVGLVLAWSSSRLLSALLYGLSVHDGPSFMTGPLLVCLAGIVAAAVPARRAARTDPALSLRAE